MKRVYILMILALLLTACGASETTESQESSGGIAYTSEIQPEAATQVVVDIQLTSVETEPVTEYEVTTSESITEAPTEPVTEQPTEQPTELPATETPAPEVQTETIETTAEPILDSRNYIERTENLDDRWFDITSPERECMYNIIMGRIEGDKARETKYLDELKVLNAPIAEMWEGVLGYWNKALTGGFTYTTSIPGGLAEDDSLCLVVLGFELNPDGSMQDELIRRLELALECAGVYPNSYVLVAGGGTATENPAATEADQMAEWLLEHGLSGDRLIIENASPTTEKNALFTHKILAQSYPQVKSMVIITSSYHVPTADMMYKTELLMSGYIHGTPWIEIVANVAYECDTDDPFTLIKQGGRLLHLYNLQ